MNSISGSQLEYSLAAGGPISYPVYPIRAAQTVDQYYSYGIPESFSANTPDGLEESDGLVFFLYENTNTGAVSLVMIADDVQDGSGMDAEVVIAGLPSDAVWTVTDDPGQLGFVIADGTTMPRFSPEACCTDGGAIGGSFDQPFEIQVVFNKLSGVDRVVWKTEANSTVSSIAFPASDVRDLTISATYVDQTPPVVSSIDAVPNPVSVDAVFDLSAFVDDTEAGNSPIAAADFVLDGNMPTAMNAVDGAFDETFESVEALSVTHGQDPGLYDLCVRGTDASGNVSANKCTTLVVFDPTGGFVTGGGWIASPVGAYKLETSLSGRATFGFVSKYKSGAEAPSGNAQFRFKTADLNFHSSSFEWLILTGSNFARFKGEGTINDSGRYKFLVWAGDDEPDTFRIKIWEEVNGAEDVIYDNGMSQAIGSGNIMIHGGR